MVYWPVLIMLSLKMLIDFFTGANLLIPSKLIHRDDVYRNETLSVSCQPLYRISRANVALTNRDITDALSLPPETLLFVDLRHVGQCVAAMKKGGVTNFNDCFCSMTRVDIASMTVLVVGVMLLLNGLFNFVELVLRALNRTSSGSTQDRNAYWQRHKFDVVLYFLVIFEVMRHYYYLSSNLRYTLPNSVYDRPYFETSFVWWFSIGNALAYVLVVPRSEYLWSRIGEQRKPGVIVVRVKSQTNQQEINKSRDSKTIIAICINNEIPQSETREDLPPPVSTVRELTTNVPKLENNEPVTIANEGIKQSKCEDCVL